MIANVVALLGSRKWFEDDQKYESFCVETVIPCCAALAVSIGKDTLWKPMNHAILLMMRDKKRVVRVVCIKALHKLFTNVMTLCIALTCIVFILIFVCFRLERNTSFYSRSACRSCLSC